MRLIPVRLLLYCQTHLPLQLVWSESTLLPTIVWQLMLLIIPDNKPKYEKAWWHCSDVFPAQLQQRD